MNMPENTNHPNPNQRTQSGSNAGTVPGIILLVLGGLGILFNGYMAYSFYATAGNDKALAEATEAMKESVEQSKEGKSAEEKEQIDNMMGWMLADLPSFFRNLATGFIAFFVLALVTALGGFGLMKGSKGLGILGGLAAMIPSTCCIIGFPVGIWAIFAAMKVGKPTSSGPSGVEVNV